MNGILQCELTKKPYKIIRKELDFHIKMDLPIPNKNPDIRHQERMQLKNSRKLRKRACDKCSAEIQTTYSPSRPEKVYCEEYYSKEV